MEPNPYWNKFLETGKVDDYIQYVNHYYTSRKETKEENNAAENQGTDYTGTGNRGE